MKIKKSYFIVLFSLMLSGNPAFSFVSKQVDLIIMALGLAVIMLIKKSLITNKMLIVLCVFIFIFLIQSIRDQSLLLYTELGFLVILFIGFAMQCLVKDFPKQYVNIMFHLGLLSLLFYIPAQIGNFIGIDFKSWFQWLRADLGDSYFHIYLHNFRIATNMYAENQEWRNAGIFWEPGAFVGYLILGLLFLAIVKKEFSSTEYRRRLTVLGTCLLTTFSTAGYLILPLLYFVFFVSSERNKSSVKLKKYFISAFVLFAIVPLIMDLPFLKDKIIHQFDLSQVTEDAFAQTRIGGFIFDLDAIKDKPFVGWGPDPTVRMATSLVDEEILRGQGNGLTGFTVKFGLLGIGLYLLTLYRSIGYFNLSKIKRRSFLLCIILILFDEQFLNFPIFLSLMFLQLKVEK